MNRFERHKNDAGPGVSPEIEVLKNEARNILRANGDAGINELRGIFMRMLALGVIEGADLKNEQSNMRLLAQIAGWSKNDKSLGEDSGEERANALIEKHGLRAVK